MIVVSGASGQLGRRVVELLLERVDAAGVVALSRTPERIADLGVPTRPADFDQPDGLARAFDGADRLLLISTDELRPGYRIRQHRNAVQAAVQAGVGHVLYTSIVRAGEPDHPAFVAVDHRDTEAAIAAAGLPSTILRENIYTDLMVFSVPAAVAGGVLVDNNGDGATGYVTREDIAAVAAAVLAGGGHTGEVLDVTGPEAITHADLAAILADLTGRPVRYQPVSDQDAVAGLSAAGMPEPVAQGYATFGRAARDGWFAGVSDVVARVAGRKPTSVADFLAANRAALLPG